MRNEVQLEELAEEGVQRAIARSQAQKVRPALDEEILNLRAESDVELD